MRPVSYPTSFPVRPADPAVRPLPFPHRGALALSNDAEFMSFEFFEALMRFMNSSGSTPLGEGLGLGLTSSVFFYTAPGYNFFYFAGAAADAPRAAIAARLDDYLRVGWIDTIHAYGDFDGVGGCTRAHAEAVFDTLDDIGARLEMFSNHGSTDNVQNVGTDAAYHRGDHAGHTAYHADLLEARGVRYVWTDSLLTPPAEGDHWRGRLKRLLMPRPRLLERIRLKDGRVFRGPRRLRGTGCNAPNLSSFRLQVEAVIDWPKLYASQGAIFLYQHLGVLRRVNGVCEPATVEAMKAQPEQFLAPFFRLKQEQQSGRLWLCGCVELARYVEMVEGTRVRRDEAGALHVDFPREVKDAETFFAGLTIAADPATTSHVLHAGRPLPVTWDPANRMVSVTRRSRPDIWR